MKKDKKYKIIDVSSWELEKEGMEVMSSEVTKNKRENYILDNILKDLQEYNLMEKFIEVLFFDSFIGQTDRHEENWGIFIL